MAHELTDTDSHYEAKRNSDDDLDYALEDAWNSEQEKADEDQIADDFLAGEHDRAGTTSDQKFEIAYDAGVLRKDRAQARAEAAAGGVADRPPTAISKKAAAERLFDAHLSGAWDAMAGGPKAGEAKPETAQPQQTDGISAEDRAVLAQAPPATQALIAREMESHRQTYGAIDGLAGRWGGYLSERGAATPEQQVGVLDNLLQTEARASDRDPRTENRNHAENRARLRRRRTVQADPRSSLNCKRTRARCRRRPPRSRPAQETPNTTG